MGAPLFTPCRSCKMPLVWATHHTTGKRMPMEIDPDGTWMIWQGRAYLRTPLFENGDPITVCRPHFANCPQADDWRRS